jgi:cell division protein YceG involved in septum cleavage
MNPDTSAGYLYFLAKNDGSGGSAFAKTQAEQDANLKLYGYTK